MDGWGIPIVLDEPDDPRTEEANFVILALNDGRWLGDEIHEASTLATGASAGTAAS